jgi:5-methylcytosine-specific restriction endonuclease McrA
VAWVRGGDTALTHPVVVRGMTVAGADSRTWRELYGTAHLLASVAGAHPTDPAGLVELGHLMQVLGADQPTVTAQLMEAGYLTPYPADDGRPLWRLIDDPDLIHVKSKAELLWDRQRKADNSKADVTLRVVLRDGSACRYCGLTVNWADRVGTRGATYDHRTPGQAVRTPDDLVVACKGCNSSRKDDPTGAWDQQHPLLPVPDPPHYCDHARARLAKAGITVDPAPERQPRPGIAPERQPRPGTPDQGAPERQGRTGDASERQGRPGGDDDLADLAEAPKASFPGTGRDGSGRGGSGAAARRRARAARDRERSPTDGPRAAAADG